MKIRSLKATNKNTQQREGNGDVRRLQRRISGWRRFLGFHSLPLFAHQALMFVAFGDEKSIWDVIVILLRIIVGQTKSGEIFQFPRRYFIE